MMKQTYKFFSNSKEDIWDEVKGSKEEPLLSDSESAHDSEILTQELGKFAVKSNLWILWAVLGAVTGGVGSLFVGKASTGGFHARTMISIGNLIAGIAYFLGKAVYNKYFSDEWRQPENTTFNTTKQKLFSFGIIFIDAILSIGGGFLVVLTFEYSFYAGINQGIISTLFSFTSVFLSVFGWLIFKEKINIFQIGGIVLLTTSAIIYGFSGGDQGKDKTETEFSVKPLFPILLALWSTGYFMLRSLALKVFWVRYNYSALDFMSLSYIIWGVWLSIPLIISIYTSGIDLVLLKDWILGGVLQETWMILMYYSISTGLSGPAAALSIIQSPIQTFLAAVFLSQFPDNLQIIGLVLAMAGSVLISVSSSLMGLLNKYKLAFE